MTPLLVAALTLIAGALLAVVVPGNLRRAWVSLVTQALATALALSASVPVLLGAPRLSGEVVWSFPVDRVPLGLDALGAFFLTFSLPMTLVGSIYALGYLRPYLAKDRHVGVHFALLNLTALAFVLVYTVENGLVFFFGWELAALSAWLLVIWDHANQRIRFAGFNYLISTHLSLLFLVAAFMVMHASVGSFEFDAFGRFLSTPGAPRAVVFGLLLTSFGLKSAFFPFHTWLPRAHSAAPAHVSALMSGVIHKAGLFGLLRFILLMDRPEEWMGWALIAFSALSALAGALYTVAQRDLKRLLGYSSTENVGLCGIGFGLGLLGLAWQQPALAALGFVGGTLHVLNHAVFKCLLFYGAGAVYRQTHTVDLERLGGLLRPMPITALTFFVGALAISGLPPLNGFVSELCLYAGLLGGDAPGGRARAALVLTAALLAFVGAVSALSMTRAFGLAFLGSPRDPKAPCHGEAERPLLLALALHAALALLLGLVPALGLRLATEPARLLLARLGPSSADAALALPLALLRPAALVGAATLALLLLLALARRRLTRGAAEHVTWGCGYTRASPRMQYTGASFAQPFVAVFRALLPHLRRERLPAPGETFPGAGHHLNTHCVDAVERRMFKALGDGESTIDGLMRRLPEDSRVSFALGLVTLIGMVALVLAQGGGP